LAVDPLLVWARAEGVPLSPDFDGARADIAPLGLLDSVTGGADVVFLGELDHFVHEKSDFRMLFSRYLLARGWRSFAEELSWSDGLRVQRFLAGEGHLDRLSLFGWTGDVREDRDDRPTGVFRASFDLFPTALMVAEQTRFYQGLKDASAGAVVYHGFDIDALPGGGYADIEQMAPPESAAFRALLARVPGETALAESERLMALVPLAPSQDVAVALKATAESLAYVDRTYAATTYAATAPGMAFREGCMKRRLDDIARLTDRAPLVLMAHGFHLAKDDRLLGKAVGVGPGGGLECSLGHHLVHERGLRAASIWLVHGAGEDSQPFPDLPRRLDYPPETLNGRLSPLEVPTLIPISGAPDGLFDQPLGVGHMYSSVQPTVLAGQVDAVLYLPRVTPMRL
jgi:erythromycin esterase-like protein